MTTVASYTHTPYAGNYIIMSENPVEINALDIHSGLLFPMYGDVATLVVEQLAYNIAMVADIDPTDIVFCDDYSRLNSESYQSMTLQEAGYVVGTLLTFYVHPMASQTYQLIDMCGIASARVFLQHEIEKYNDVTERLQTALSLLRDRAAEHRVVVAEKIRKEEEQRQQFAKRKAEEEAAARKAEETRRAQQAEAARKAATIDPNVVTPVLQARRPLRPPSPAASKSDSCSTGGVTPENETPAKTDSNIKTPSNHVPFRVFSPVQTNRVTRIASEINIAQARDRTCHVNQIPSTIPPDRVIQWLSGFGHILKVRMAPRARTYYFGFVEYAEESSLAALQNFDRARLQHSDPDYCFRGVVCTIAREPVKDFNHSDAIYTSHGILAPNALVSKQSEDPAAMRMCLNLFRDAVKKKSSLPLEVLASACKLYQFHTFASNPGNCHAEILDGVDDAFIAAKKGQHPQKIMLACAFYLAVCAASGNRMILVQRVYSVYAFLEELATTKRGRPALEDVTFILRISLLAIRGVDYAISMAYREQVEKFLSEHYKSCASMDDESLVTLRGVHYNGMCTAHWMSSYAAEAYRLWGTNVL